jgi:hypothetical protein
MGLISARILGRKRRRDVSLIATVGDDRERIVWEDIEGVGLRSHLIRGEAKKRMEQGQG